MSKTMYVDADALLPKFRRKKKQSIWSKQSLIDFGNMLPPPDDVAWHNQHGTVVINRATYNRLMGIEGEE